jgi:hypothetical protein
VASHTVFPATARPTTISSFTTGPNLTCHAGAAASVQPQIKTAATVKSAADMEIIPLAGLSQTFRT